MNPHRTQAQVLVLVAHADDETIGCGGYIPILMERGLRVAIVIASSCRFTREGREVDNRPSAVQAGRILGADSVHFLDLEDQLFERYGTREISEKIEALEMQPGLILTHCGRDLNRDHRVIHEIALLYARPSARRVNILASEIINNAEYFGDAFRADYYVNISRTIAIKKQAFACYVHEARPFPHPYSADALDLKARQRGMEAGVPYAEAYQVIRWFDE